uniref:Uncharacterized protein n=1 Tax=Desertifilum tharense IPPAS B-1220 TaxID=1781255 RepID=A0ACD5GRR8_9CYAN
MLKTLKAESPEVQVKAVDFDPRLSAEEIAQAVVEEFLTNGETVEVGYPGGQRTIFQTVLAPVLRSAILCCLRRDWVVLLTGGARGITAEVVQAVSGSGNAPDCGGAIARTSPRITGYPGN